MKSGRLCAQPRQRPLPSMRSKYFQDGNRPGPVSWTLVIRAVRATHRGELRSLRDPRASRRRHPPGLDRFLFRCHSTPRIGGVGTSPAVLLNACIQLRSRSATVCGRY